MIIFISIYLVESYSFNFVLENKTFHNPLEQALIGNIPVC